MGFSQRATIGNPVVFEIALVSSCESEDMADEMARWMRIASDLRDGSAWVAQDVIRCMISHTRPGEMPSGIWIVVEAIASTILFDLQAMDHILAVWF